MSIIYNSQTSTYVMWMHIDSSDYQEAKAGVATSATICGDYSYLGSSRPLGFESRDIGLFKVHILDDYESPAMYKSNGIYFMFGSSMTGKILLSTLLLWTTADIKTIGWNANDNVYSTATSLSGPWSGWNKFAAPGSNTYYSQTTAVVSINGVLMYMGDRWEPNNLMSSTYIWLPLTISGTTATMDNRNSWIINPSAGTWSPAPAETVTEAEAKTNTLTGSAIIVSCSGCSGYQAVGWLGGSGNGALKFPSIASSASTTTTIRIQQENGDTEQRYGNVTVNGVSNIVAFLPSRNGNTPGTSVLTVPLKKGSANVIKFEAYNGGYVADIDQLILPSS
ncbi:hypothetical protein V499_07649 [Pseudogymnoascus sp. VKM F-103]|nr:hypothetical protein V499_07649 [Pseudogymnoascus sp. VKM F-103]